MVHRRIVHVAHTVRRIGGHDGLRDSEWRPQAERKLRKT